MTVPISPVINPASGVQQDATTGLPTPQKSTDGAAHVADQAVHEGQNSDYDTMDGCIPVVESAALTADGLVVTGPCRIMGFVVHAATATNVIVIKDGVDSSGVAKVTIVSGTSIQVKDFGGLGIECLTGCFLDFTGTGTVSVLLQLAAGSVLA